MSSRLATMIPLAMSLAVSGQAQTTDTFIDRTSCPGECCQYGEWTSRADVVLYDEPRASGRVAGHLVPRERVRALSGEVHTIPGRFVVHRRHEDYRPGDVILVYTYLGEGFFRVEFDSEIYEEELGFGPHGVIPDSRCSNHPSCFGELEEELVYTWWVQLELPDGSRAWTRDPAAFEGTDGCG